MVKQSLQQSLQQFAERTRVHLSQAHALTALEKHYLVSAIVSACQTLGLPAKDTSLPPNPRQTNEPTNRDESSSLKNYGEQIHADKRSNAT